MKNPNTKITSFIPSRLSDWELAAKDELKGADPWKKLGYDKQGLQFKPFYTPENSKSTSFQLSPGTNNFLGARTWYNCPLVRVGDPSVANQQALEHLKKGADGIYFELTKSIDFRILLRDIEWPYCSLNFLAKNNQVSIANELKTFFQEKYSQKETTIGAFFGKPDASLPNQDTFYFLGYPIPNMDSPSKELVHGISTLAQSINGDFQKRSGEVAFSVEIGTDFFIEIIKLRALRIIWERLVVEKKGKTGVPIFIHAHARAWNENQYSPHSNMVKSTPAAMAAILGGCDALTVEAEDQDNDTLNRIARNVSNILREEAHFSRVADPMGGSYFVESMTQQLVEDVWKNILPGLKS